MAIIKTNDNVELYVKDWGEGRPFVLVHGWPLNADMWDTIAHELVEQGFRVVAYDRRGFGRSSQPGAGYDYDTLADDLAAVIEGLSLIDVTLVGFSMGGGEVARYMSRHRGRNVAHVALVSAVTPYLLKDDSNPDGVDGATFDGFIHELKKDRPGFLETFGKQFYGVGLLDWSVSSAYLEWTKQMALQASLRATIKCVDAFGRTDFRADMKAFDLPTLVIHGTSDATVPFEISGKRAAEMIPGAELKAYDGAPHGLHYTEQDRLVADLVDFAR
ncbi:MAG: alpha/beta hydrolase [Fulvimarina sp.]|nr:alpha/beta hydrolase [Fulvimarina sp.]